MVGQPAPPFGASPSATSCCLLGCPARLLVGTLLLCAALCCAARPGGWQPARPPARTQPAYLPATCTCVRLHPASPPIRTDSAPGHPHDCAEFTTAAHEGDAPTAVVTRLLEPMRRPRHRLLLSVVDDDGTAAAAPAPGGSEEPAPDMPHNIVETGLFDQSGCCWRGPESWLHRFGAVEAGVVDL